MERHELVLAVSCQHRPHIVSSMHDMCRVPDVDSTAWQSKCQAVQVHLKGGAKALCWASAWRVAV